MKSQTITSEWYNETGEKCLRFYKKSQDNEIIQLKEALEKIPRKSKILDAGCGFGKPVAKFLSQKKYQVTGIDISKELIQQARKNAPKAKFKVMSMYDLTFPEKTFDAIVSFFAILHLEKSKVLQVFKKFHQILKDNGYLLFSVNRGKEEGYFEFFGKKVFFSAYTKKEIEEILRKTGFKIIWKRDFFFETPDGSKEHQLYYFVQKK
ncbi:MAG: class I SAM-dependent methyltransferase [Candidatus Pacearchaeota archaeon]